MKPSHVPQNREHQEAQRVDAHLLAFLRANGLNAAYKTQDVELINDDTDIVLHVVLRPVQAPVNWQTIQFYLRLVEEDGFNENEGEEWKKG